MKILWTSNAGFISSGYGVQTDLFTRQMVRDGHEAVVFAWYGHHGPPMTVNGVTVLPQSFADWGNDALKAHAAYYDADVTLILGDAWVMSAEAMEAAQPVFWCPVDHASVPPLVREHLFSCRHVWSMSRFGHEALLNAGLRPVYVPHGVDTDVYRPLDRAEARAKWDIPDGAFFAMTVAANKGWPSRKSLDRLLKAWAAFVRLRPDAILYLHTLPTDGTGIDLEHVARFYGIARANLRFPDLYRMVRNEYSAEVMNGLYNAADAFVLPSAGEGFGVPAIEAQAAGCPVILTDATAQTELCGSGWLVEIDRFDDMAITLQYAEQANVRPRAILAALEQAYAARDDAAMRENARAFALDYDYRRVWREFMLPALESAAADKKERAARREKREKAKELNHRDTESTEETQSVLNQPTP